MSVTGDHMLTEATGRTPPDLPVRYTTASGERLFAIMLMSYEAETSQSGRVRSTVWRRS
jgi:hypothetical protein